ncbi:MAG: hypothetical protein E6R04_08725 [Spirochaetes bacterium]|nr:MAG: hypothetical protein E6R04_08725 [Spirochaetota bacterium]
MIFAILPWIQIIFFLIGNGPTILKLIIELRGLLKDMSPKDAKAVILECKDELRAYKKDGDKEKVLKAVMAKKIKKMNGGV